MTSQCNMVVVDDCLIDHLRNKGSIYYFEKQLIMVIHHLTNKGSIYYGSNGHPPLPNMVVAAIRHFLIW